jgi:UDP-N-acetylglucosamine 3-dehydrogenase
MARGMDKLRAVVIGAGFWGRNHARVLSEIEDCELYAIVDIDLERAERVARRYGIRRVYRDFREVASREDVDFATVCTPTVTHASIARNLVENGIPVLVEKPLAGSIAEASSVADAVKSSGVPLMVGFIERFNPAVQYVLSALSDKTIGTPLTISARRIGPWPERIGDVGVVKDVAIHDIDLTYFFFQEMPIYLYASGGALRHSYEDYMIALMSYDGGKAASLEANWLSSKKKRDLRITGTDGVVSIEFLTGDILIEKPDYTISPTIKYVEPLKNELSYFVEKIKRGEEPAPGIKEGIISLAVAEGILISMRERRSVYVADLIERWGVSC